MLCQIAQAERKLDLGNYNDCFDQLRACEEKIETLTGVESLVYAELYKTFAQYFRRKEDFGEFYKYGLQFLAYTNEDLMTAEEQKEWSIKMGMAVLLGKNIYNIGELINKKILKALEGTDF